MIENEQMRYRRGKDEGQKRERCGKDGGRREYAGNWGKTRRWGKTRWGKTRTSGENAFCTHPASQAWEEHGKKPGMHSAPSQAARAANQAWEEHGKIMGEHGKHQGGVHSAPVRPARHGKSMGKAWESMENIRRECILHPFGQPGMREKHGRAWETSVRNAFCARPVSQARDA